MARARDFEQHYAAHLKRVRKAKEKAEWDRLHPGPYVPAQLLNKEGRVFSSQNRQIMTQALDGIAEAINAMQPHLAALNDLMVATDPAPIEDEDESEEGE